MNSRLKANYSPIGMNRIQENAAIRLEHVLLDVLASPKQTRIYERKAALLHNRPNFKPLGKVVRKAKFARKQVLEVRELIDSRYRYDSLIGSISDAARLIQGSTNEALCQVSFQLTKYTDKFGMVHYPDYNTCRVMLTTLQSRHESIQVMVQKIPMGVSTVTYGKEVCLSFNEFMSELTA